MRAPFAEKNFTALSLAVIDALNSSHIKPDALSLVLKTIKSHLQIHSIAVRFDDKNLNFPYYRSFGFNKEFLTEENNSCSSQTKNEKKDCLCGYVLNNLQNPDYPNLTPYGSLHTNNLEKTAKEHKILKTKSRINCTAHLYKSIALIPLKKDGIIIGLLQLNDKKEGVFSPSLIEFLEKLSTSITAAYFHTITKNEHLFFKNAIKDTNSNVVWIQPNGKFIYASENACRTIDMPFSKLKDKYVWDITPKFPKKKRLTHWKKLKRTKNITNVINHIDRYGRLFFYQIASSYVKENDTEYEFVCFTDITEHILRENELRNSETQYKMLFDSMLNAFAYHQVIYDKNTNTYDYLFVNVNPAFEKMTGFKRTNIIGKTLKEIFPSNDLHWLDTYTNVVKFGKPIDFVEYSNTLDKYYLCSSYMPQKGFFAVIFEDYTERKKAELALKRALEKEKSANHLKNEFLSTMSHEIRTPLNAIIGYTDIILQETKKEHIIESLNIIQDSGYHLLNIIDDIIDISLIESNQMKISYDTYSLEEIITNVINQSNIMIQKHNKNIKLNLKPFTISDNIVTDKKRLMQVLINLINNSIKFTDTGSIEIKISLTKDKQNIIFDISDSGIGIAEDKIADIFKAFTQLDMSESRKSDGIGLGLTITQKIIKSLNGSIVVKSTLGKGSTFTITLPFNAAACKNNKDCGKNLLPFKNLKKTKKILFAEDNIIAQKIVMAILKDANFEITTVINGEEAIKAFSEQEGFHLVLMDVQMDKVDGLTATREIRALEKKLGKKRKTPIIALTGAAMLGDQNKCLEAGCTDYIAKPFTRNKLVKSIAKYL